MDIKTEVKNSKEKQAPKGWFARFLNWLARGAEKAKKKPGSCST
jgi:hypothetical protein